MALFGEKYGDQVRMVTIGDFSKELCGGTHVGTTGEVGAFLVAKESSTAAGIRRIEAITGNGALDYIQQERKLIHDLTSSLKISKDDLLQRIQELMDRNKKLEKEIERLKSKEFQSGTDSALVREQKLEDDRRIFIRVFEEADPDQLGNFVDETFRRGKFAGVVAASVSTGSIAVRVVKQMMLLSYYGTILPPNLVAEAGGRKDFAKGGLKKDKRALSCQFCRQPFKVSNSILFRAIILPKCAR